MVGDAQSMTARGFLDAPTSDDLLLILVVFKAATTLILYLKLIAPDHITAQNVCCTREAGKHKDTETQLRYSGTPR